MTQNKEWMTKGNMRLYPMSYKLGFSRGKDRFILQVIQRPVEIIPEATVQLIIRKSDFKEFVGYLSKKLTDYEKREGEIEKEVLKGEEIRTAMTVWKPDEIYWED